MFTLLLFLHLATAIFAVGPLVHFATTAGRGLREGDAAAVASSARGAKIYAMVSVLVLIFGFGLMSMDSPYRPGKVAEFSDPFIWISAILSVVALGLVLGVIVPALEDAGAALNAHAPESGTATSTLAALKSRVAACGGVVGLLFLLIVWLMVYKPGS